MAEHSSSADVDRYIAAAPPAVQPLLHRVRVLIRAEAPDAAEIISYGMPAYRGRRVLVYFAAAKAHLGFYPTPNAIVRFRDELAQYKTSKGAIQFPYARPLPEELIREMVRFRVQEDAAQNP